MAEITIVNQSELDKTEYILTPEYYGVFVVELDRKYKNSSKIQPLKKISLKDGIRDFGSYSLYNYVVYLDKKDIKGIPLLRVVDISENYVNYKNSNKIDETSHYLFKKSQVKKNDILFSIGGTLGIAVISSFDGLCNSNQSLAKISIDENKANPYYVTVYLNSEIGKSLTLRGARGGVQQGIPLERTRNIPIYLLNRDKQNKIGDLYLKSIELMKQAINKYDEAERELIEEIGLNKLEFKEEKTYYNNFKEVDLFERIDADFFQPKYEKIITKIQSYKLGHSIINKEFKVNKEKFEKNENYSYNYVEIGSVNIFDLKITPLRKNYSELPDNCKVKLKKNNLLISKVRPYRGAVSIVEENIENLVGSTAFTILSEKTKYKKEILLLLLRTTYYQELMMKYNVGTSYPVVKDEDILNLPIPLIDNNIQEKLSKMITDFLKLRNEAEINLQKSKEILFVEIEKELNL